MIPSASMEAAAANPSRVRIMREVCILERRRGEKTTGKKRGGEEVRRLGGEEGTRGQGDEVTRRRGEEGRRGGGD